MTHYCPVVVEQDVNGVFVVGCSVFDACRSYRLTLDEAMSSIREAIELCVQENECPNTGTVFLGIRDIELTSWCRQDDSFGPFQLNRYIE